MAEKLAKEKVHCKKKEKDRNLKKAIMMTEEEETNRRNRCNKSFEVARKWY